MIRTPALDAVPALLIALFVAACGDEGGGAAWTAAVDTVGGAVRVVNVPPESGPVPTMVAEEVFRVGPVEGGGPTSFGLIRSVAALPDGRFAVADGQAEELRLFDRDGEHLRTFGGRGAGPGELEGMQGVYVDPTGMLRVAEQGNARLSVFDPDTGVVTSYPLRLHSYSGVGPWEAAVDSGGRTLVASAGQFGQGRFWRMLRVYDPTMIQLDSIPYYEYTSDLEHDVPGAWRITLGDRGMTWVPVPFYSKPHRVLAPTGEFWSSTEGKPELEVARWAPPNDTSLVLVSLRRPDPVTPVERDSAMRVLRQGLGELMLGPPSLDASRVPASKPPLHGLFLDDRARLWVRLTELGADTTVYDVFDRDGRHAETVRLPFRIDRFVPPAVRGDTLWAVVVDHREVQSVIRARLRPFVQPGTA